MALRLLAQSRSWMQRPIASMLQIRCLSNGSWGDGAGKGGGTGGSVRDSGGSFGKREAAQEEQYFRKQQAEQLAKMRDHLHNEIEEHERQIKAHQEAIARHKQKMNEFNKSGGKK